MRKYTPKVVMVTGSVGKTSTKDAVAAVLAEKFYLRKSEKSFNSEIGVPLTIIGSKNPWSNPLAWLSLFGKALVLLFLPNDYPQMLVLEVGADQPGDLQKILRIVKPDAVVVTLLPSVPVHVEFYTGPEQVREEEFSPARALQAGAPLIISADDSFASDLAEKTKEEKGEWATVTTYGTAEDATARIEDISVWLADMEGMVNGNVQGNEQRNQQEKQILGMQAKLVVEGRPYPLTVPGALGRSQLFAPAAAIATGLAFGMIASEALEGLEEYTTPPGRGRVFEGKKGTLLIDDTYNSSPAAVEEILASLSLIPQEYAKRKVVVLGDMLELGVYSEAEHARVGHMVKGVADVLITLGNRAKGISDAALADGMPVEKVWHFGVEEGEKPGDAALKAAAHLEQILEEGDVVLVKGSQGVRMERIVRPLLAHYEDISGLVRQDEEWQKR